MANTITVELSAKDADMVAAWQRQRDNISAFEEKIHSAHRSSESWGQSFSKDLQKFATGITETYLSFEGLQKAIEVVIQAYDEWNKKIDENLKKQKEAREELTHTLALAGHLADAPKIEAALKDIEGATPAEARKTYQGVNAGNPDLSTDQQLDLTRQIAPLAAAVGEEGVAETGRVAGTLQKVAPDRSAFDIANLAHAAMQQVDPDNRGDLVSPASVRALQILQKSAGMSPEQALAFETEAMHRSLVSKDVEKIADEISSDKQPGDIRGHDKAAYEKQKFYAAKKGHDRLELLAHDGDVARAVLGDREAQRLGLMDEASMADREAKLTAAHQGGGAIQGTIAQQEELHPGDEDERYFAMKKAREEADIAARHRAFKTQVDMTKSAVHDRIGHGPMQDWAVERGADFWTGAHEALPDSVKKKMDLTPEQIHEARTIDEVKERAKHDQAGGAGPHGHDMTSLQRETNRLLSDQNHLLLNLGKQQPQVAVNVQTSGGGRGRVDYSHRNDHSPSMALASNSPHPRTPGDGQTA